MGPEARETDSRQPVGRRSEGMTVDNGGRQQDSVQWISRGISGADAASA